MIKIINDQSERLTTTQAEIKYPNCKILLIDYKREDNHSTGSGYVYAISDSQDTSIKLVEVEDKLQEEGEHVFITGSYNQNALGILR